MFTDSEMKKAAMSAVTTYFRSLPSGATFDMDACLKEELNACKREYNSCIGIWKSLCREDLRAINASFKRLKPELEEMTRNKLRDIMKRDKAKLINATTATAIIDGLMEGTGLEYRLICQSYRVKLIVALPRESEMLLCFNYTDLFKKDLSGLPDSLKYLAEAVSPVRK